MSRNIVSLGNAGVYGQSPQLAQIIQHVSPPFLCFKAKLKYPKNKAPKLKAPKTPKIKPGLGGGQQAPPQPVPVPVPQPQGFGGFPRQGFGGFPQQGFGGFPQQGFGGFQQQGFGSFPQQGGFGGFSQQQLPPGPPIPVHTLAMTHRQIRRMYRKAEKGRAPRPCENQGMGGLAGLRL
jgi:hypothetical protein